MYTTDPIYKKPLIPRITIKSLDNATTYYTYDPWTDAGTTTKPIYCNVQLSQNHQGIFTVQIEDQTKAISTNVDLNARVIIECGKQSTQMTKLISGLIRQTGYSRGADGKVLYTLSGSSTAVRLNEVIIYFVQEARKLAQDGVTLDITDPSFIASLLLQTGLAPVNIPGDILLTSGIQGGGVTNFVPSVTIEYGEAQDLVNAIEEASNGELYIDTTDAANFIHQLLPPTAGRGFTIKNKNANNDNADDTMYLRGRSWDFTESISKADNYSNNLYGILPNETDPTGESVANLGGIQTNNNEIAQKFRPTHSHWLPGDLFFAGFVHNNNATISHNLPPVFRVCKDNGAGIPLNTNGIVMNIIGINNEWNVAAASNTDDAIFNNEYFFAPGLFVAPSFELDMTQDYWLIAAFAGSTTSDYFRWDYRATATGTKALAARGASTNVNGGTGWVVGTGTMWFDIPRRRSQAFQAWDPKAVKSIAGGKTHAGRIETTLSSIPGYVKTKEAMYRYMSGQLYYMSRPRVNYNFPAVTAPNIPILPGDPILISDSVLGISATGSQAVMATCGDMNYSWSSLGGQGQTYQAPTILSINAVSNPTRYR